MSDRNWSNSYYAGGSGNHDPGNNAYGNNAYGNNDYGNHGHGNSGYGNANPANTGTGGSSDRVYLPLHRHQTPNTDFHCFIRIQWPAEPKLGHATICPRLLTKRSVDAVHRSVRLRAEPLRQLQ